MSTFLIDTHCHLDFDVFNKDRTEILKTAALQGVCTIINPTVTAHNFENVIKLFQHQAQQQAQHTHLKVYPALGLHPCFTHQHAFDDLLYLEQMIQQHRPIAIGECGLDFYIEQPEFNQHKKQFFLFEAQLKLARHYQLPVIIHARKALDFVINLIKKVNASTSNELLFMPPLRGVVHSFSGSLVQANRIIALGFYVGFGGPITYPRATRLHQLVKTLPLNRIVLESDAPDQPIFKEKGQRNTPQSILTVCQEIATLRGLSFDEVASETTQNANILFNLTSACDIHATHL